MITRADVLPNPEFAAVRPARQRELLEAKQARRFTVGGVLTFLFENRVTVLWQIQEMCRVEHITAPEAVQHEIDTYVALLPTPSELSATLLLEYTDVAERERMLTRLVGLEHHLWLEVDGERLPATFDTGQFDGTRVSSVQFVRFPLTPTARAAFFDLARPVRIVVDHPALQVDGKLGAACRGALVDDLTAA